MSAFIKVTMYIMKVYRIYVIASIMKKV